MSVTAKTVQDLIDSFIAYAKNPQKLDLKLINGIVRASQNLGGAWNWEEEKSVPSCFEGITLVCWRFSAEHPQDAAKLYEDFVLKNYNFWYHMDPAAKPAYRSECHTRTDNLADWHQITTNVASRHAIFQQAINVTSAMYGTGTKETNASEQLWNSR